ncbi:MAG: HD domain-containing protein [Lachnospiraceae bacterium]|nr:HD domain-containing protein [Lachnospiraceae bacterium]
MPTKPLNRQDFDVLLDETISLMDRAIIFATRAHSGTYRKGTSIPYIVHPIEAAAIVSTMTDDPDMIAAAVLHDVVEDTDATVEEIRFFFNDHIARLVEAESENKRKDLPPQETWMIRKMETLNFLRNDADREAKILALADKLSNIRAIHRDQNTVGDKLWERFNEKRKDKHGWMYRQVAEALSELQDTFAWQEYDDLVRKTFEEKNIKC